MGAFRFQWPSAAQPARFTTSFEAATGAVGIYAPPGAAVLAGAAGRVVAVTAGTVLVQSGAYLVVYDNVRGVVAAGDDAAAGDVIAESLGPESFTLRLHQAVDITRLLTPPVVTPDPAERETGSASDHPPIVTPAPAPITYVRATLNGVRVRDQPVDGQPIGHANTSDRLESLEAPEATRQKLGVEGQWLQVRTSDGVVGYMACQFLEAAAPPLPGSSGRLLGINLDIYNPLGRPDPAQLASVGWIRVKFNVSLNPDKPHTDDNSSGRYGNTDIAAAFQRYYPVLEPYARAGVKILMVFTHQLYGEGAGYNWNDMDGARWRDLTGKFADCARHSVELWQPTGFIHAYQIWNEQDTEPGKGRAAVPIPAAEYGALLAATISAIRTVDAATPIITGGHTRGPEIGSAYARAALAAMPPAVRPDGIATHPYGRGVKGHAFSNFGALEDELRQYGAVLPGQPVWITEWGVLGRQGDVSIAAQVADYAAGFMRICRSNDAVPVAACCWYAWADGMDDGYGLVDSGGTPKPDFCQPFLML